MTTGTNPPRKPTLWLTVTALLAALGIAILWPLQYVGQVCILIYPAPPGCGAQEPRWVPFVAIALVIGLLATVVVLYFTRPVSRTTIILLAAGIIVVVGAAAGIVALSQVGIWDPYQPLVVVD